MFSVKFSAYLEECNCSAKDFSKITGISEPTVSRYRSGRTIPSIESGKLELIADTIEKLSNNTLKSSDVYEELLISAYEDLEVVDYRVFSQKLAELMSALNITKSKMAEEINVSSSYLSKICNEQVKPRNPVYIAEKTAGYISYNYSSKESKEVVSSLMSEEQQPNTFTSEAEYRRSIRNWLLKGANKKSQIVDNMFYKYRDFSKNRYFDYDEEAVISTAQTTKEKGDQTFKGLEGAKRCFLSWMDAVCDSKVNDEVIIYDEVLTGEARKDPKYACEYAAIVERIIKSGKTVIMIHNLEGSLHIAAKKIVGWLPLVMSGRISHYYINEKKDSWYKNTLMVSSNCAFIGNVIDDDYEHGYYMMTKGSSEVLLAKARAHSIAAHAKETYRYYKGNREAFEAIRVLMGKIGAGDRILAFFPIPMIFMMREETLVNILKRDKVSKEGISLILENYHDERKRIETLLKTNKIAVDLDIIDEQEWDGCSMTMLLAGQKFEYTKNDYKEHMKEAKELAGKYPNLELNIDKMYFSKNIVIFCVPGKFSLAADLAFSDYFIISEDEAAVHALDELFAVVAKKGVREDPERMALYTFIRGMMKK